jgi:hypothetical protein
MLNYYLSLSEATLNKAPHENRTALLMGLNIIKQRVAFNKSSVDEFNNYTEGSIKGELKKVETKLKSDLSTKVKTMKEKNSTITEKLLKLEEKILVFSKRANTFEVKASENNKTQFEISKAEEFCNGMDKKIEDLKYFFDHKKDHTEGDEVEKSAKTNERLQAILVKDKRNSLIDYLQKTKTALSTLSSNVTECERDTREISKLYEKSQFRN